MPSDIERAIRWSKRFEAALARRYSATGRGLHERIDSVESKLDRETVRSLRLVATVRNKLVHEEGYDRIDGRDRFNAACKQAARALGLRRRRWPLVVGVLIVAVAGIAGALWLLTR